MNLYPQLKPSRITVALSVVAMTLLLAGCGGKTAKDYLRAGDAAMQATNPAEAEQNYREAVRLAPHDPSTHMALGNFYVLQHRPDAAQIEFMKVLDADPGSAPAHAALAGVYATQSHFDLAEEQYRAAVVLEPTRADYRVQLAAVLEKAKKLTQAEAQLRTAIGLEPRKARPRLSLADLLSSQSGRSAQADVEYARAKAINPKLAVPPSAPTPALAATAPPSSARTPTKLKRLNKRFLLTKNSAVYQRPDSTSAVVAHVRRKKYVRVTGITGDWLRIKLRSGTVGFIPVTVVQ